MPASYTPRPAPKLTPQSNLTPASWTIPALAEQYGWPTSARGGGVIAVYAFAGGFQMADVEAYFASIGQPVPSVTNVSADGVTNNDGTARDEVTLDICVSAASYQYATGRPAVVRVYWDNTNYTPANAIQKAAADGCDVFTTSWGFGEYFAAAAELTATEAAAAAAAQAGMAVLAAAGDGDATDGSWGYLGAPGVISLDFPSCCPHVTAVGGSSIDNGVESVWNFQPGDQDGTGTGGGFSPNFPVPSWQTGIPTPPAGLGRMTPDLVTHCVDVAFIAGGVVMYGTGTSISAPFVAGLVAACGQKPGFITPLFYANPAAFNDITIGDNGLYHAAVGPDPVSGMGSPKGALLAALITAKEMTMQTAFRTYLASINAAFQSYLETISPVAPAATVATITAYFQAYIADITPSVVDAAGNEWSFGAISSDGVNYDVLQNGAPWPPATGAAAVALAISGGVAFIQQYASPQSGGAWFTQSGDAWASASAAPVGVTASLGTP